MNILVTRPDNVTIENGEATLKDPSLLGVVVNTHLVPIIRTNEEGLTFNDIVPRVAVCWHNQRSPAVMFEASEDLYWLEQDADSDDEDEDEDDFENEEADDDDGGGYF